MVRVVVLHCAFKIRGHHASTHRVVVLLIALVVTYITMERLTVQCLMPSLLLRHLLFDLSILRLIVAWVSWLHPSIVVMLHVIILHLGLITNFLDWREIEL